MARGKSSMAALAVAIGIFLSRVAGLIRDRIFAHYLGNSAASGAFKAALRIPNFLQNLFGEGVLSASFIPVYARLRAEGRDAEALKLAGSVATLLAVTVTLLAALGTLSAKYVIELLAPGFTGEVRALTVQLVQIMFPGVALLVLSAWCLGVLNSHRRFLLAYVAPVLWNVAIIIALCMSGRWRDASLAGQMEMARDVAWGTVVGCLLQLLVQLPLTLSLTRGLRPTFALKNEHVRTVLKNFVPVVTSRGVVQVSAYIDGMLASFLGAPIVAAMAYAQQLYLLPVSLFGMSISAAQLPTMSSVVGNSEEVTAALQGALSRSLKRVAYFVIPSVMALALLGDVVIATIFQTGQFTHTDVMAVWMILLGSTVGLLAQTQGRLCSTTFYAMRDTRTPLRFALLRVILTSGAGYAAALPLRAVFGYSPIIAAGLLTASAGAAGWIEFLLLRHALRRKLGEIGIGAALQIKLWLAALAAGGVSFGVKLSLPPLYPVFIGIIVLGCYGLLYLGVTIAAGIGEGAALRQRLRGPVIVQR